MLPMILLALALAYSAVLGALWWGQERLLFHPEPLAADHRFDFGTDVHEAWVDVPGARLNALHLRLPRPDGVVFFLHGNAGNLQSWFNDAEFYRRVNLDLFMIDYRGYGKSSGRISGQAELEVDVRLAWASIAKQYRGQRRVFLGQSLGTALAASIAAEVQPELTVLVSPYESMIALAAEHYPWVPRVLLRYPLRTDEALMRIRGPVLLAHGEGDMLISIRHSERLHARAPNVRLLRVPGVGHGDVHESRVYLEALHAALTAAAP